MDLTGEDRKQTTHKLERILFQIMIGGGKEQKVELEAAEISLAMAMRSLQQDIQEETLWGGNIRRTRMIKKKINSVESGQKPYD